MDLSEGTRWGGFPLSDVVVAQGKILGNNTALTRDLAIKLRVQDTEGVTAISRYFSIMDPNTRRFSVQMTVDTIYGQVALAGGDTIEGGFTLDFSPLAGQAGLG